MDDPSSEFIIYFNLFRCKIFRNISKNCAYVIIIPGVFEVFKKVLMLFMENMVMRINFSYFRNVIRETSSFS